MANIRYEGSELVKAIKSILPKDTKLEDVYFACIGTDRSTGDSLGPIVGWQLAKLGYTNIMGTLDDPLHAMNLDRVDGIKAKIVIAIDACLGKVASIGKFSVDKGPLKPGAGVNKELPPVGDYHITGIVNVGGFMEYFVLQNTRLNLVIQMATAISNAIQTCFPLEEINYESDSRRETASSIASGDNTLVEEKKLESRKSSKKKPNPVIGD